MSLSQKDLQNIKEVNKEGTMETLMDFWDKVLEPNFTKIDTSIDSLQTELKKDISEARDYIDKRTADRAGESVIRDRTLNQKSDTTAELLEQKMIFSYSESERVKNTSPFPTSPLSPR